MNVFSNSTSKTNTAEPDKSTREVLVTKGGKRNLTNCWTNKTQ